MLGTQMPQTHGNARCLNGLFTDVDKQIPLAKPESFSNWLRAARDCSHTENTKISRVYCRIQGSKHSIHSGLGMGSSRGKNGSL